MLIFLRFALESLENHNKDNSSILSYLGTIFQLYKDVRSISAEDVAKVSGILNANSFRIDGSGSRALFIMASMINHNCCPNARVVFDNNNCVTLKAKRNIMAGEELTITYCCHLLGKFQS